MRQRSTRRVERAIIRKFPLPPRQAELGVLTRRALARRFVDGVSVSMV
jgi:hypothetical protein